MGNKKNDKPENKGGENLKKFTEDADLKSNLGRIKHKIMVLSGKGGVGKSTVAANIAVAIALEGKKVGILDTDFHGPSIPTLLNLNDARPTSDGKSILPVNFTDDIKVMSIGFMLPNHDDAVIWRGPMKMNVIKQLLTEVNWGDLDYLVIDFPPGTGDEPLSVAQLIPGSDGAIIVTTPQDLSINDVKKCINFCRQVNVPVLGVVENMSGLVCPHCKNVIDIFKKGGGEAMAAQMGVPFLGRIPIEPMIVEASDAGKPFVYHYSKTEAAKAFSKAVEPILHIPERETSKSGPDENLPAKKDGNLRIAVPVAQGRLSAHFGHCEEFALFDVDTEAKEILAETRLAAPPHEPGLLPVWLAERQTDVILAGGMGQRAQGLFTDKGIKVCIGASADEPQKVVTAYLNGELILGDNICDH
ncbi:MAG TPA: chromosome partitioning protein ParA [Deltaproteobacteria bacterium]|nr:chromosome partitioning protein ParA [Deltaproteobacteria bacterium]